MALKSRPDISHPTSVPSQLRSILQKDEIEVQFELRIERRSMNGDNQLKAGKVQIPG
jgi:hypothetical protein